MIVEPFANDELQNNLNPIGQIFYLFSTLLCTPCSRSQEVGLCFGAQSGEKRMKEVVWLDRSVSTGSACWPFFLKDPCLRNLRGMPEFELLISTLQSKCPAHLGML
jgi:hypothetical protein